MFTVNSFTKLPLLCSVCLRSVGLLGSSMVAKRCYYEVLGLQRGCDNNAIKVAYRKLALKYHPDKNPSEEATALFQEIQEANSVLSDPQERAWYDSHRDEILRGGDGDGDSDDDDAYVVNVWPYFSGGVFSGYGDDEYGFYSVFRELFERIDVREREGALRPSEDAEHAPTFGDSTSAWPVISAFYAHWGDFVSKLSFGWADEYREHDAPSRQVRRAMEKENRKARDSARRKYQDTIRALVDHIKKRDKRVTLRQLEVRKEEAEKARLREEAAKKKAEEYKKQRAEWLQQQRHEWEEEEARRLVEAEDGAGGEAAYRLADESGDSEDEDEWRGRKKGNGGQVKRRFRDKKDAVVYDCAVCNKSFKSEKQLHNHQKSKTHRKMVESLREEYGDELLDDLETFKEIAEQGADDVVNSSTAAQGDDGDKGNMVAGDAHSCNGVPEQAVLSSEGNDDGGDEGVYKRDSATGGVKEGLTAEDSDSDEDDVERMSHFASAFRRGINLSQSDSDG